MKKFIKDWWPLLLIAGWWLWKKKVKKTVFVPKNASDKTIAQRLEDDGWFKGDSPCPECGSDIYVKGNANNNPYNPYCASFVLLTCCTNPKCPKSHLELLPI